MIDAKELLTDCRRVADALVDDLRARTDDHEESRESARLVYAQAQMAGRTDKTWEEWREDLLAQVASGWVLAAVFVRFCEDNRLVEDPLLSGPGDRGPIARDHRAEFFAANPEAGDREWLQEVFDRYRKLPAVSEVFGERNPLWQLAPSADGARALLELWWATDDGGTRLRHDFTDVDWSTRFLGDLYQDLSEHARKQYALLQTPDFVEEFILDRTLDPAITEFGLADFRMIDPTCGSGHFVLGAFDRLVEAWRGAEPNTPPRELAQRALNSVHGVDVNPFAVAIARFRLLVAALRVSGETRLENLPGFRLNLAVGDSLLHGSHGGMLFPPEDIRSTLRHHYPTEDAGGADEILQAGRYHVAVGNPPYITVKDPALNSVVRSLYASAYKEYALTAPFTERFHDLVVPSSGTVRGGYVGQITSNSFMKRDFGVPLVRDFLPSIQLTHVIDTSGADIPGHATPTVILLSRRQKPGGPVRAVLGIRGDESGDSDSGVSQVWDSITTLVDQPGSESEFISVEDLPRQRFAEHPWSLQGGHAPAVREALERGRRPLESLVRLVGYVAQTNADDAFVAPAEVFDRVGIREEDRRPWIVGHLTRDWVLHQPPAVIFPYGPGGLRRPGPGAVKWLWPRRTNLWARRTFNKLSYREDGKEYYEWHQVALDRIGRPHILFSNVASSNHFVLDPTGAPTNSHAPFVQLHDDATLEAHAPLLALLNSSVACFWLRQVCHKKTQRGGGGGAADSPFTHQHEFSGSKVQLFPVPDRYPQPIADLCVETAMSLAESLPQRVAQTSLPTASAMEASLTKADALRAQLVALQEELDWECYDLYGLTDGPATCSLEDVPILRRGERAFEIALARRIAAGETTSTWFEYHDIEPVTELPDRWPNAYRTLVERRLELIGSNRSIRLLERPEYKRRWNWDDLDELGREAQRTWLGRRVEELIGDRGAEPAVTTVARLADRLAQDPDAVQVARDLAGASVDLVELVGELVAESAVPFLAAWRYTDSGMVKRRAWERTWDLQRIEDQLEARAQLPEDDRNHLDESGLKLARKDAGVEKIPVPPKYATKDFRDTVTYKMRGKLDVPKERFISYPGAKAGADTTALIGWAGWDHLQQARALAAHYNTRRSDGAEDDELVPLLAGLAELLPWLKQWHNDPDPTFGERMGEFFAGFVDSEAAAIGVTTRDLADWRPPAKNTRRRKKKASS